MSTGTNYTDHIPTTFPPEVATSLEYFRELEHCLHTRLVVSHAQDASPGRARAWSEPPHPAEDAEARVERDLQGFPEHGRRHWPSFAGRRARPRPPGVA